MIFNAFLLVFLAFGPFDFPLHAQQKPMEKKCKQLACCDSGDRSISAVRLSPDGTKIVVGHSRSDIIEVWNPSGKLLARWGEYNWMRSIRDLYVTSDNKIIYTTSVVVGITDLNGNLLREYNLHARTSYLAMSADERTLQVVCGAGQDVEDIRIFNFDTTSNELTEKGQCVGHKPNGSHKYDVNTLVCKRDGTLVSSSHDYTLKTWDSSGALTGKYKNIWELPKTFCLSYDQKQIIAGFTDGTIRLLDSRAQLLKEIQPTESPINTIEASGDGHLVFCAGQEVFIWQPETKSLITCKGHTKEVYDVCIINDKQLASCSADHTIRIWDMYGNQIGECRGHTKSVYSVTLAPDHAKLISESGDNTVRVWDLTQL